VEGSSEVERTRIERLCSLGGGAINLGEKREFRRISSGDTKSPEKPSKDMSKEGELGTRAEK